MQTDRPTVPGLRLTRIVLACLATVPTLGKAADEGHAAGEKIYRQRCATCHGAAGEGTEDDYPHPLAGDRSVPQLAKLIAKTMPSDDPGTCKGEDADKVASYIYDTFYSKAAQARNKPPRVELTRLTVRQYRNAVADVIGGFRAPGQWDDRRGLQGEYYKSKRLRGSDKVIDRLDPEVKFDFMKTSPDEKIDPKEFAIRWQGSVLAPETGEYEFIVRTENSARLWVNDPVRPLIDASVKSGDDTEYRGTIRLLAGRAYPIKLEYTKGKQGVEDKKEKKEKAEVIPGSIALEWKVPNRVAETIPARALSPVKFPETFVVETPFPPDDRSVGYERGTSVSKAWDGATTDAAIETAGYVSGHLKELAELKDDGPEKVKKLREFAGKFAERAFRRPLTDEQKALFIDRQFAEARDPETAVKRVVLLVLKSPRFLYHELDAARPDAHAVASRVSFGLWDSLPDAPLLEAAAAGKLATREQVAAQAERMSRDLRARAKLREFFLQWLRVDGSPDIAKDPKQFPGFDPPVVSDLRTSLDLLLDDVITSELADFRRLLLEDSTYLNGRLAKFYGLDGVPPNAPFKKFQLDPRERAGVLTHPYLMACFSYTEATSPIHRGVFLMRSVLGRSLRPPPQAVSPLAPDLHAGLSTRERVALQTSPTSCMSCHGMINPLGFGLERFDAVGRYRPEEKGKAIDATGTYESPAGELMKYTGARELANLLADSQETHSAFVEQVFHHVVKQPIRAFGPREHSRLRQSFADHGFNIRKLTVEIIADSALPLPVGWALPTSSSSR
jgi:hypothetical protein